MRTLAILVLLCCACSDGGPANAGVRDGVQAGGGAMDDAGVAGSGGEAGGAVVGGAGGAGGDGVAVDAGAADSSAPAVDSGSDSGPDSGADVPGQDAAPHTLAGYGTCREDVDCYGDERCVWWPAPRPCDDDDDCPIGVCRATSAIGDVVSRTCQTEPCTVTGSSGGVDVYSCAGDIPGPPVCARPCGAVSDCARPEGEHTADVVCDLEEGACRLECGEQFLGPTRTCPDGMNCTFGICTAG